MYVGFVLPSGLEHAFSFLPQLKQGASLAPRDSLTNMFTAIFVVGFATQPATLATAPADQVLRRPDTRFARNITVFHVNQHSFGAVPVNMDTADLTGDLFFDLLEVLISPLLCQNHSHKLPGPDPCTNPEAMGADLVVNKVTLEVDSRFSGYAACNVCVEGQDPFGGHCEDGKYICDCLATGGAASWPPKLRPCNTTVGFEEVYSLMGKGIGHKGCRRSPQLPSPTPAQCYVEGVFGKLTAADGGAWYSSLEAGFCGEEGGDCTWRVASVDKIVSRSCHVRVFGEEVQRAGAPECLDACGKDRTNVTSPCWVSCLYKAALGPDAGHPDGKVGGLSLEALKQAWAKPFLGEESGGCPALEEWAGGQRRPLLNSLPVLSPWGGRPRTLLPSRAAGTLVAAL